MIADVLKDGEERMNKALEALNKNLGTIRTGRANPALLDRVTVEYYGTPTPLNQLSNISTPEARLIVIQPYDRNTIGPIEKAIRQSDLGLNPNNDGQLIRLAIPPLTEERRKQMVKTVHSTVEEGKVAIRNVRRDALQQARDLLAKKEISEDDERRALSDLDALTKKHVEEADKLGKAKELEVLEV
ncbi:MAG TPA: ribosome recycling factor [Thermomicrobiales bacterium]|jgi:ribosome recycling factor|nr:ribosome recycling factor [Thermomicrobiales bacterium]